LPDKSETLERLGAAVIDLRRPARAQAILEVFEPEIVSLVNDPHIALEPKIADQVLHERHDLAGQVSYSSFKYEYEIL